MANTINTNKKDKMDAKNFIGFILVMIFIVVAIYLASMMYALYNLEV